MFLDTIPVFAAPSMLWILLLALANAPFALSLPQHALAATTTSFRDTPTLAASVDYGKLLVPALENATAVDPQDVCPGYTATRIHTTESGVNALLSLKGKACNAYGKDIDQLELRVQYQTKERLSVQIFPANVPKEQSSWYFTNPKQITLPFAGSSVGPHGSDLVFNCTTDPFAFSVSRKSTGDVLFDTTGTKLVFENQFLEFKTTAGDNVYGLGESITDRFRLTNSNRTLYSADIGDTQDANLYGVHPFYLEQRYFKQADGSTQGFAHGVFSRNFHGQEILVREGSITYRYIGGSIDLYFYSGPTPGAVTQAYVSDIGLPALQQYWTYGFHQCRWGYANVSVLAGVVQSYKEFDIPLETIWTDIDYMQNYRDFTTDENTFPEDEFSAFLEKIHTQDQHYIPIVDAAIYAPNPENKSDAYEVYTTGHEQDVFIKNEDGSEYIGAVWPGFTVFPDWSAANTQSWWTETFSNWFKKIAFDGIWLDMNEVSSFCVGSCGSGNLDENQVHPPFGLPGEHGSEVFGFPEGFEKTNASEAASASTASSSQDAYNSAHNAPTPTGPIFHPAVTSGARNVNWPPYTINNFQTPGHDLAVHAVSPNATHADGTLEYDVHSLWGFLESRATYQALTSIRPGQRPFLLSRSTAPGSGSYAAHWGGDNDSVFYYMRRSIQQALNFALFGIPMFGVDTCGFNGNSDLELCSRWMQLSAFFPFYRNHNTKSTVSQEAYIWAEVAEASKTAMQIRYSILPYLYTLMYNAHATGSTVMRALSWEFPDDPSLVDVDYQFMLGSALMVLPVLDQGETKATGSFPGDSVWYDWYTGTAKKAVSGNVTVDAPLGHIPVYVQGGNIIPMQQPGYTTTESRKNPFELLVALSPEGTASGELYLDDGVSIVPRQILHAKFTVKSNTLTVSATAQGNLEGILQPLSKVTIFGVSKSPKKVMLGGSSVSFEHNASTSNLTLSNLATLTKEGAFVGTWTLKWEN